MLFPACSQRVRGALATNKPRTAKARQRVSWGHDEHYCASCVLPRNRLSPNRALGALSSSPAARVQAWRVPETPGRRCYNHIPRSLLLYCPRHDARPIGAEIGNMLARPATREYRTWILDSRRWQRYRPRADDIIIATYPKCGTTWMQRIVGLLVFQTPEAKPIMEIRHGLTDDSPKPLMRWELRLRRSSTGVS